MPASVVPSSPELIDNLLHSRSDNQENIMHMAGVEETTRVWRKAAAKLQPPQVVLAVWDPA